MSSATPGEIAKVAVLGDLHLDPNDVAQMNVFAKAREQLSAQQLSHVVSLGDLGGYACRPGSLESFHVAKAFLDSFGVERKVVLGNHDLEGEEFGTDAENLEAWIDTFEQQHYWCMPLEKKGAKNPTKNAPVLIGLSTTRFRSNRYSCHEVHIDNTQFSWFLTRLREYQDRPVFVFTHAPFLGCGLRVLQTVHLKNRCAWLNQTDDPEQFIEVVRRSPQIKAWFSGHFHLSHNYQDSVALAGSCACVQVGVIGDCNRDGHRHSRLLRLLEDRFEVYTVDHGEGGSMRLDVRGNMEVYEDAVPEVMKVPGGEALVGAELGAHVFCASLPSQEIVQGHASSLDGAVQWMAVSEQIVLGLHHNQLVEYDVETRAPIGMVCQDVGDREVVLVRAPGRDWEVTAIELKPTGPPTPAHPYERIDRNEQGSFWQTFQPNRWKLRKQREQMAAAAQAAFLQESEL